MSEFVRKKVNIPDVVSAKWSREVVDEGFVPFPKRMLRCMKQLFEKKDEYVIADLQVILAIADYNRPNLASLPSYDFLAFTAGMPVGDFKKRVDGLRKRKWLVVTNNDDDNVEISLAPLFRKILNLTDDDPQDESVD